ncbi:Hypothetical predicted protein [Marmota monax]|uniref:Uncharacterized protein n=1 Tax=Marmota monax TaxID=9995 RepID=A0A5E4BDN1_MARMO|nr:hypothetical protein GHT09_013798 [Marmota monax]VTJ66989.1 Hypothetical predicted protein [Marmota monax]
MRGPRGLFEAEQERQPRGPGPCQVKDSGTSSRIPSISLVGGGRPPVSPIQGLPVLDAAPGLSPSLAVHTARREPSPGTKWVQASSASHWLSGNMEEWTSVMATAAGTGTGT